MDLKIEHFHHRLIEEKPSEERTKDFYFYIGKYALSPELAKEYNGYPLLNKPGWNWLLAFDNNDCVGFLTYTQSSIENVYVRKDYRGKGVMSKLFAEFKHKLENSSKINLIATKMSKPIFEKYGFTITMAYKNWWKMEKFI